MQRGLAVAGFAVGLAVVLGGVAAYAAFPGTDVFLPAVGRNPGVYPSQWYCTVWVYNPGDTVADVSFYLLLRDQDNSAAVPFTDTVQPGATKRYDNAVSTMFGVDAWGAMRVTSDEKVIVNERFYDQASGAGEEDSQGQDLAGLPASFAIGLNETTDILGVYQTEPATGSSSRYNYGFVETAGKGVTVRVTPRDETGAALGSKDYALLPFSQRQFAFKDEFPSISTTNARLSVQVISGSGRILAYGSDVANGSQDPTTFEMGFKADALGLTGVQHDGTLTGDGTATAPLGIAAGGVSPAKIAAAGSTAGQVLTSNGSSVSWQNPAGLALPFSGTDSRSGVSFAVANQAGAAISGQGPIEGVIGQAPGGAGVYGQSDAAIGVFGGTGSSGIPYPFPLVGVFGNSDQGLGVLGTSGASDGVRGTTGGGTASGVHGESAYQGVSGANTASATDGCLGCVTAGAVGSTSDGSLDGVIGSNVAGGVGVYGSSLNPKTGVTGPGVLGVSTSSFGVKGVTSTGDGVYGQNQATSNDGCVGCSTAGVIGFSPLVADAGVHGNNTATPGGIGVYGTGDYGVYGGGGTHGVYGTGTSYGVYGSSTGYAVFCNGNGGYTGTWSNLSDRRLKQDIATLADALGKVLQLRGVSFYWRRDEFPDKHLNPGPQIGFIAQEVEPVLPEVVTTGPDGFEAVDYSKLTPILTEAIKEQQAIIEEQRGELERLEARVGRLEALAAGLASSAPATSARPTP